MWLIKVFIQCGALTDRCIDALQLSARGTCTRRQLGSVWNIELAVGTSVSVRTNFSKTKVKKKVRLTYHKQRAGY